MKRWLFFLAPIVAFTSCVSNRLINQAVKPTEIKEIAYFEPLSFISLIEKGNKAVLSDSLSLVSRNILDSVISKNTYPKISKRIEIEDLKVKSRVDNELKFLIRNIVSSKKLNGVKLTPTIDSILQSTNQRFALATVTTGFGRRKGNYGGQVAKGIGVGILTLGMYAPVPVKSNSTLYAILIDSERNEAIYFCQALPVEKSPTDSKVIDQQYRKLFQGYFYK
jgi:hypothetical protein